MNNEAALRELRDKIGRLSNELNKKLSKSSKSLKDFDVDSKGYEGKGVFDRISAYGFSIDIDNLEKLGNDADVRHAKSIISEIAKLIKTLEEDLEIIKNSNDATEKIEAYADIKGQIDGLADPSDPLDTSSALLSEEEVNKRLADLNGNVINGKISKSDIIKYTEDQIKSFKYDINALKTYVVLSKNPELAQEYSKFEKARESLEIEQDYRDKSRELLTDFNEYARLYKDIEYCQMILSNLNVSTRQEDAVKRMLNNAVEQLNTKLGYTVANPEEALKITHDKLEDIAFKRNCNNGIIDNQVLARDMNNIWKHDKMQQIERNVRSGKSVDSLNSKDLQAFAVIAQINEKSKVVKAELEKDENDQDKKLIEKNIKEIAQMMKTSGYGSKGADKKYLSDISVDDWDDIIKKSNSDMKTYLDKAKNEKIKVLDKYGIRYNPSKIPNAKTTEENIKKAVGGIRERKKMIELIHNSKENPYKEIEEIYDPADYMYNHKGSQLIEKKEEMHYDVNEQINEIGVQRIESGKVYRCERIGHKILHVKEDLEIYLKNPKKKLNYVLDSLADKIEEDFEKNEDLKKFMNDEKSKKLKDLTSKNPFTRMKARKNFIEELEKNGGLLNVANMAIALNSEIIPEDIVATLDRTAQPYTRDSDMSRYVETKQKGGFLGMGKKDVFEISETAIERAERIARNKENLGVRSKLKTISQPDGTVRPFEITDEEMGRVKTKDMSKDRDNGQSR